MKVDAPKSYAETFYRWNENTNSGGTKDCNPRRFGLFRNLVLT